MSHSVLADLCSLSYDDHIPGFEFVDVGGLQLHYRMQEGDGVFIFRGTDQKSDWLINGDVEKVSFQRKGKIHRGFLKAGASLFRAANRLRSLYQSLRTITLAGHSLGGALAGVIAASLIGKTDAEIEVVTVGAPKIADRGLADYLSEELNSTHYQAWGDKVPLLPILGGYKHYGETVLLGGYLPGILHAHSKERYAELIKEYELK